MPPPPLIRCKFEKGCNKPGCTFIHPHQPDWYRSRESTYSKYSNTENAYLAEAKGGPPPHFKSKYKDNELNNSNSTSLSSNRRWGEPPPSTHGRSSSGDFRPPDAPSGSHSRTNSGDRWGTSGAGFSPSSGQERNGGHAGDRQDASGSSSSDPKFPGIWDKTVATAETSSHIQTPSGAWGNNSSTAWNKSPARQDSGSWTTGGGGGWGSSPKESSSGKEQTAAAADANNPWAQLAAEDSAISAPWGTTNEPWGAPSSTAPAADPWSSNPSISNNQSNQSAATAWGTTPATNDQLSPIIDSGKGKGKARADVEMSYQPKDTSVPPTPISASTPVPPSWPTVASTSTPTVGSSSKAPLPTRRQPRVSSNLVPPESRVSAPLPTRQKVTTAQRAMADIVSRGTSSVSEKSSIEVKKISAQVYDGPEGRVRLYKHLIRVMARTAGLYFRKKKADTYNQRVSSMANSVEYQRATVKTREILNLIKSKSGGVPVRLKSSIEKNLKELALVPNFAEKKPKQLDPRKLMQSVVSYTAELQEWFRDLELGDRASEEGPAAAKPPKQSPTPVSETPDTPSVPSTPSSTALPPKALAERGTWTWKDLKDTLALMQARLQEVEEEHYSLWTSLNDQQTRDELSAEIDAAIEGITRDLDGDDSDSESDEDEDMEVEAEEGEDVDDTARREAERIAIRDQKRMEKFQERFVKVLRYLHESTDAVDLPFRADIETLSQVMKAAHELTEEVTAWKAQREEMELVCEAASRQLAEMETWNGQAAAQLASLQEKARELANMKDELMRPSPQAPPAQPPTPTPAPLPQQQPPPQVLAISDVDFNELLNLVRPVVLDHLRHEVNQVSQTLQSEALRYQGDMQKKVTELVQPAIRKTNELCERVDKNNNQASA